MPPEEIEVDRSIGPVLPDISLGPNVSSLGVGLDLSSLGVSSDVSSFSAGGPSIPSSSTQNTSTEHTDLVKPSLPPACSSGIEVSVSQSPTSAALSSKISGGGSSRGEGVGASMTVSPSTTGASTSDRGSSTTLLPLRPAGDRDSGMSTMTVTPATIVSVSGAVAITLATASVVDSDSVSLSAVEPRSNAGNETEDGASVALDQDDASMVLGSDGASIALDSDPAWPEPPLTPDFDTTPRQPTRFHATSFRVQGSPHSSHFSSDTGSTSESAPLVTPKLQVPPSPLRDKSFAPEAALLTSTTDTFGVGGRDSDSDDEFTLSLPKSYSKSQSQRLPGWIVDIISPLSEFMIDVDPQEYFADLQEIAEGESGSVYAARLVCPVESLSVAPGTTHVAVKSIAIHPAVSPKLQDLSHEMELMRGVHHEHVLRMDAFYVNLVDDSVWIRMELMERSLADVVGLVGEGLSLQERMIARFASDVSLLFCFVVRLGVGCVDGC